MTQANHSVISPRKPGKESEVLEVALVAEPLLQALLKGHPVPSVEPHAPTQDPPPYTEEDQHEGTAMDVDQPAVVGDENTVTPRANPTESPLFTPQTTTTQSGTSDATESTPTRTPDHSLLPFGITYPLPRTGPPRSTTSPPPRPISATAALIEKATEATGRLRALTQPFERSDPPGALSSTGASAHAASTTIPRGRNLASISASTAPTTKTGAKSSNVVDRSVSQRHKRITEDTPSDSDDALGSPPPKDVDSQEEDDSSDYYVSDTAEPTPGQPRPTSEASEDEEDDAPPRPSSFSMEKIVPHSGRIPKTRVWTMIAMRVPGVPGSGVNCKMACVPLVMEPTNYKETFAHYWVLRYTLFWNRHLERWTFLPSGWAPDWPADMRYPASEESLSKYWLAVQHKISELRLEELRRAEALREVRRRGSITPPPPASPSAIRMALHEAELRNPSMLRKPGSLDWTWLSSPLPSESPSPIIPPRRLPSPGPAPPPAPRGRPPSPGPSRRPARASRLPARYNDFEADPNSDLANTKILAKEVSESDATDTRDLDFSTGQDTSASSDEEEGAGVVSDEGVEEIVSKKKKKNKPSQKTRRRRQRERSRTPDVPEPAEESTPRPRPRPRPLPRRPSPAAAAEPAPRGEPSGGADLPSEEDDEDSRPRPDKGKGRAPPTSSSSSSSSSEDNEDDGPRPDKGKGRAARSPTPPPGPRPLTESELAELRAIHQRIAELADETRRTTKGVLEIAGFERVGLAREMNPFNIFESWLSFQDDTPSLPRDEFVQYAKARYREIPREEIADLAEQWQIEVFQHQEQEGRSSTSRGGAVREITQASKQLDGLCRRVKLTTDLDLVCLLTSRDPVARQLSAVYSSSDSLRAIVDQEQVLVRELIERFVTAMQSLDMGIVGSQGLSLRNILNFGNAQSDSVNVEATTSNTQPAQPAPGPSTPRNADAAPPPPYSSQVRGEPAVRRARVAPPPRPTNAASRNAVDFRVLGKSFPDGSFWVRKHGESNKDYHRRIVRFMFQVKFAELVDEPNFTNFWKKILGLLVKHKVVLRDWPAHLPAPGTSNFDIGRLDLTFTSELCNAWRQYSSELVVPPWFDFWASEYSDISRDDLAFMDIPLVMGLNDYGEEIVLVEVRDCPPLVEALATRWGVAHDGGEEVPPLRRARARIVGAQEYLQEAEAGRGSRLAVVPRDRTQVQAPATSTSAEPARREEPGPSTSREAVGGAVAAGGATRPVSPARFVQGSSRAGRSNRGDRSAGVNLSNALDRLREPAPTRAPRVVAPGPRVVAPSPAPPRENEPLREHAPPPPIGTSHRERDRSRSPSQSPARDPPARDPLPRPTHHRRRHRSPSRSRSRHHRRRARSVSSESRRSIHSRSYHGRRRPRSPSSDDDLSESDSPARHRHSRRRYR
ncbi:hypothetical protein DFP72DRAFT_849573 [Ephemerocybe angulata]|uniref:Uncharacterized protein n=1 Tax=Ephemerocybe angulata TaxID=980116 RepID=A0A8H6HVV8_9AGAR|nr:hypothetical protein DFP72DRAFT_849573 [Tulosesus angulatus]